MSVKKFISVILISVAFCLIFNVTKAATAEELLKEIARLQALIAQLQKQLAEIQGKPTTWCHDFNTNLKYGDRFGDVGYLQSALEKEGFSISEDEKMRNYFGDFTASAVVGFQEKYKDEILTPVGLTHGTGFVGPATRAKLNKLYGCGAVPPPEKPYIKVLSPNGGERWEIAKSYTIRWTPSTADRISIKLYKGGSELESICSDIPNTGSYNWSIPHYLPPTSDYKIWIGDSKGNWDWSDNYFSIVPVGGAFITVLSPNGGEKWVKGNTYEIRWKAEGINRIGIDVVNFDTNTVYTLVTAPNDLPASLGKYSWKVGSEYPEIPPGDHYKIRIFTTFPQEFISDESDGYFSIVSAPEKSITVLSPNGGEKWVFGIPQTITWSSVGIDKVVIYLWFPDGATCKLADNVPAADGKYTITIKENQQCPNIPRTITAGQYKIGIWSVEPALDISAPHDYSDNYFSIVSAVTPCFDSDGSLPNPEYIKGYVIKNGVKYEDVCYGVLNHLQEYYCGWDGSVKISDVDCPYGCKDGACVIKATDSDNSPDYLKISISYPITPEKYPDLFIAGVGKGNYLGGGPCIYGTEPDPTTCKPTSDNYTTYYDHCANSTQLNEAFVTSDGKLGAIGITCPYGCKDGACIKKPGSLSVSLSPDIPRNQTFIKGQNEARLAKINFTAGPEEDIKVTLVEIRIDKDITDTFKTPEASDLKNIKLIKDDGTLFGTIVPDIGDLVISGGSRLITMSGTLIVKAGSTASLTLVADIPSATLANSFEFYIPISDVSGYIVSYGVTSGADIAETGGADQIITINQNESIVDGYNHYCFALSDIHQGLGLSFNYFSIDDSYLRYFMIGIDCPEANGNRWYTSSGCVQCSGGGKYCNIGTGGSGTYYYTFNSDLLGQHIICTWPSSETQKWNVRKSMGYGLKFIEDQLASISQAASWLIEQLKKLIGR